MMNHQNISSVTKGLEIKEMSLYMMKLYLGFHEVSNSNMYPQIRFEEWTPRINKKNMYVESTMVVGNKWQVIRVVTTMTANKDAIKSLMIDDSRIGEFEDMFDTVTVSFSSVV